jgi:AmmeMemoRadiSam system protein B
MLIIENHDLRDFQRYLEETRNTICGRSPIQLLLAIILESGRLKYKTDFVKYSQSGEVKDANDSSVSYASAIVC